MIGNSGLVQAGDALGQVEGFADGVRPLSPGERAALQVLPLDLPEVLGGIGANLNPAFTVRPGTAPELVLSGAVSETNGPHGLIKAGAGTLQATGPDTYSETTAITTEFAPSWSAAVTSQSNGVKPPSCSQIFFSFIHIYER